MFKFNPLQSPALKAGKSLFIKFSWGVKAMSNLNTTNTSLEHGSMAFFRKILDDLLDDLLKDNLKNYGETETTLIGFMDYLTRFIKFHPISETDLNKLISIRAKFLSLSCHEAINNNQTKAYFDNFTQAIQEKEEFFHSSLTKYQTRLQKDCEITPDNPTSSSSSLATQVGTAAAHGVLSGSIHAAITIALDSLKNKGYTETQLKLFKAGSIVLNSVAIASYASIATYMENTDESEAAPIEKMAQAFALSLASTTSLYALTRGINYLAKSIENKLGKGFLNALPLAGNLGLLARSENNLATTAAMIGVNMGSASVVSTAIQTGWHFFSKRRNTAANGDVELEAQSTNVLVNAISSPLNETTFSNEAISSSPAVSHVYEEIGKTEREVVYASMERLDEEDYLVPTNLSPATHSSPNPPLPVRNLPFLLTGGLDVFAMRKEEDKNKIITPSSSFSSITYSN